MRRALVIATVAALAVARPETYREKEDFQYSRSSSDEGTKSGFYGAQRGNMGGNYERAHNMDVLAQHQMGGLVRTVDGDLGDGAKQKSGSVFSAASSRGVYGSGHYDLSNLQGRNFQESTSFGDAHAQSSLSHQAGYGSQSQSYLSAANNAYGSQSQNSRYRGYGYNAGSDQALYASNRQSADNLQSASQYDGTQLSQGSGFNTQSGYNAQSGYQGHSIYDQAAASQHSSNAYGASSTRGSHYRLVGASPVRVYVRPGSTISIPVAAQSYDASQGSSSLYDQSSQSSGSTFNQNSINSEAEVLGIDQQSALKPTNDAKRYESSYSYRKEWEKHNTVTSAPLAVPTVNPYPSNSELYEDTRVQGSEASAQEARSAQASSQYRGYNIKSAGSRQAYNSHAQEHSLSSDAEAASSLASSSSNGQRAYNYGASTNLDSANPNTQVEDFGSKPKSYQSSYSYHKSWEHQGDPYVIKPSTNGLYTAADSLASQRLTSSSLEQGSGYGSSRHGSHYHQGQQGYSYDANRDCDENGHIRVARSYNLGRDRSSYQQSQNTNEGQEYVGQQSQNLEELGQQSQNLEDFGQQSQNLQDFGQQSQKLEDFGQQSQNLHDFGQQSQNLDNFDQQSQNLEDLGQQTQNLQNVGQESQNLEDFGQQSQNVIDIGQQSQNLEDFGQLTQDNGQLTQNFDKIQDLSQQAQNQWDQQSQTEAGQQTQNTWSMMQTIHNHGDSNIEQQSNGMEHTGFNHQVTQGSILELNHPSLNQPELQTTQDKPNPFVYTVFDMHSNHENTNRGAEKEFPQLDLSRQPGQHTQFNWQPFSPDMNQNNQNTYVPISPLDSGSVRQDVPDWQKYLEAHGIASDTGYDHQQHSHYQTVYGTNTGTSQTSYDYNPYTQSSGYASTGYAKPMMFPFTYSPNPNAEFPSNINTAFNPNPWMIPPLHSNSPNTNLQNPDNVNVMTNTQTYVTRNNHSTYSTNNVTTGIASINNLWDLIDDTEKPTTSEKETDFFNHLYHDKAEDVQNNKNLDLTQNANKTSFNNENHIEHSVVNKLPSMEPNIKTTTDNLRPLDVERGDIEPEKLKPQEEAGRGDIGPEDNDGTNALNKPLEILGISPTKPTGNKTLQEIETLSLTKENNKTKLVNSHSAEQEKQIAREHDNQQFERELAVLSLVDQKKQEHHSEQDNWKLQNEIYRTTSTTPKSGSYYDHPNFNVEQESQQTTDQQRGLDENTDQQSYNQFGSFDQQDINLDQQNIDRHVSTILQSPDEIPQNMDQQFETLGQQTEDQQSFHHFEDLGQKTQNNFGQQSEGFQQESLGDFGQQSENLGREHQKPDNYGQQSEGFQQESLGDFGQQSENLGQKQQNLDNFRQQSEVFHQESLGDFGQQSEHLGQEQQNLVNFGQQTEDFQHFGQKSEVFQQESLGDFGQQSENLGQEQQNLDNFGQQSEDFQQESLGEFGQQSELLGQEHQRPGNFGQQSEGFQQENLGDFGQQGEPLGQEHQTPNNFGQQSEGFQQESLGDFGQQSENLGQGHQKPDNFGQQSESIQLESIGDFKHEQLQQVSLPNFYPRSENLDQSQNNQQLENRGQENENLEQQSQTDLWKPDLGQQQTSQVEFMPPTAYNKEGRAPLHSEPVVEPEFVTKKTSNVDTPPEPVTEKAGFWKSAKNKVKSWFSSS